MKKEEALALAPDKSRVIIEYLTQILSDQDVIKGKMNFNSAKIDNQNMCTTDIYVPSKNYELHLNMGITTDHVDILYKQLFNNLLDTFLEHETVGISRFYMIKYSIKDSFEGINATNINGSKIELNFIYKGNDFFEISENYNQRISQYIKQQEESSKTKK